MSDAIFIANKASGHLAIGDKEEMDKATWRKPRGRKAGSNRRTVKMARLTQPPDPRACPLLPGYWRTSILPHLTASVRSAFPFTPRA
jgi:hypothetical protein